MNTSTFTPRSVRTAGRTSKSPAAVRPPSPRKTARNGELLRRFTQVDGGLFLEIFTRFHGKVFVVARALVSPELGLPRCTSHESTYTYGTTRGAT